MQSLIFGFTASLALNERKGIAVPEPDTFQPFDIQALRHIYSATEKSVRQPSAQRQSQLERAVF